MSIHSQVYPTPLSPDPRRRIAQLNTRVQVGSIQADLTGLRPYSWSIEYSNACPVAVLVHKYSTSWWTEKSALNIPNFNVQFGLGQWSAKVNIPVGKFGTDHWTVRAILTSVGRKNWLWYHWFIVHNGILKHHWCLIYSISDLTTGKFRGVPLCGFYVSRYNRSGVKWTYHLNLGPRLIVLGIARLSTNLNHLPPCRILEYQILICLGTTRPWFLLLCVECIRST